jgi:DSF synthase
MTAEDPKSARWNLPHHSNCGVPMLSRTQNDPNRLLGAEIAPSRIFELIPAAPGIAAYQELDISFEPEAKTLWCYMRPMRAPSITPSILHDFLDLQAGITLGSILKAYGCNTPLEYYVQGSRIPGIYNLGGDLAFMTECVRTGDRESLLRYAHDCVQVVFNIFTGFSRDVVSIGLIEGDALGGGFEAALCCNFIIAERSARFGLPEILFNCFPGMGAYSFLSRRVGPALTEEIMLTGKIYTAAEMHDMGIVNQLAENGCGKDAVKQFIRAKRPTHAVRNTLCKVRQRSETIQLDELRDITEMWVDITLKLSPSDLKVMQRLLTAQQRRLQNLTDWQYSA